MTEPPPVEVFPVAIGRYTDPGLPDLDAVDDEVTAITELLAEFGGNLVPWDTPMAERGSDAVDARLEIWTQSTQDCSVLYWVGHGGPSRKHPALAHANSPAAVGTRGVGVDRVAEAIARRSSSADDHWMIVVIDTCWSARFTAELSHSVDTLPGPRHVLLIGASGDGSTTLGRFTTALRNLLHGTFAGEPRITLWDLIPALRDALPGAYVTAKNHIHRVVLTRTRTPVTGNPLDVIAEVNTALARLGDDEQRHFVRKAQGAELGEQSWYFTGREQQSEQISAWLREHDHGLLVVTGRAGSGKSALLGHLLVQSHPGLRAVLCRHGLIAEAPERQRPPDDVFDVVLHLSGLSTTDAIARLAGDAGLDRPPADADLTAQLDWLIARITARAPVTILADALDEAVDPVAVADAVLRRLAAVPLVRVVVGTRRSTREGPDRPDPDEHNLLDALQVDDHDTIAVVHDSAAITRYVLRKLSAAAGAGRLDTSSTVSLAEISAVIGSSRREFLFARLAVHEILTSGLPTATELEGMLAGDHRDLFTRAVRRLADRRRSYYPLLRALGFSRGRGLPIRQGVFATVARALGDAAGEITDEDIHELRHDAAPYLMLDREHDQTVYRLAHRTFAELFTTETAPTAADRDAHRDITRHLVALTAEHTEQPVNRYVEHYLSAHAGLGGRAGWQALNDRPDVLDRIDPRAVSADAMRTAFGSFSLPARIAGVVGASHLLAHAVPSDRRGLRQLAMTHHTAVHNPMADEPAATDRSWAVVWAAMRQDPLHRTMTGHTGWVGAVTTVTMPDGRVLLATGGADAMVRLWDPATGHAVGDPLRGHTRGVPAVTAVTLPDGRVLLATGSDDSTVRLWDAVTGRAVGGPLTGHTDWVGAVTAVTLPDGRVLLATGSNDSTVRLWDAVTGRAVGDPLTGHSQGVRAVVTVALPDGRVLLASGSADRTVRLWDPSTGRAVGDPLTGHTHGLRAMAAVPLADGRVLLATCSDDATVRLWDPATGSAVGDPLIGHTLGVRAAAAVPLADGRVLLATGSNDATVRLWDPATGSAVGCPLTGHTDWVTAATTVALPDGRVLLATGSDDSTVRLWDPVSGSAVGAGVAGHTDWVTAAAAVELPDGRALLATGGADATARLWDPLTCCAVGDPLIGHTDWVGAMTSVVLCDGRVLLATGSDDTTVRLWDSAAGGAVGIPLAGHTDWVGAMTSVVLRDGRVLLATGGNDATVRLWDPAVGCAVGDPLTGHTDWVTAITTVVLPDGRVLLATGGNDATVRLWDPAVGCAVGDPLTGHTDWVTAITTVVLPDGRVLLATGGNDATVRLWDPVVGCAVGDPLTGHTLGVRAMAAVPLPDGRVLLATGGKDATVRLWDPVAMVAVGRLTVAAPAHTLAHLGSDLLALGTHGGIAVITLGVV